MANEEIVEAVILPLDMPPRLPGNKLAVRYRVKSVDFNQISTWSPVYYLDAPMVLAKQDYIGNASSVSTSTTAELTATGTSTFTVNWKDENVVSQYDIFASFSIDLESFTATIRSVGTTKYIYFTDADVIQHLEKFSVGSIIDVGSLNAALNGAAMAVTAVNISTSPYYIQYTGDSSNTLANTAATAGFIIFADDAGENAKPSILESGYEFVGTYTSTGSSSLTKSFQFGPRINTNDTTKTSKRAHALIQVAGSTKTPDLSLAIAETARVGLI